MHFVADSPDLDDREVELALDQVSFDKGDHGKIFPARPASLERSCMEYSPGFLIDDPLGGLEGSGGEDCPVCRPVGEFDALADTREHNGVFSHDVPPRRAWEPISASFKFPDHAGSSVRDAFCTKFSGVFENLEKAVGSAAGGILFQAMVHLDDFWVESGLSIEDAGGLLGEIKEQVDAGREITRPDHGDPGSCFRWLRGHPYRGRWYL